MKKNDVILIGSITLYSFLFYEQGPGVNFLIFNVALIALLLIRDKKLYQQKSWLLAAGGSLLSAACITLYANGLSVAANIMSLAALSAFSIRPKTSIITSIGFSFMSVAAAFVFMILDLVERSSNRPVEEGNKQSGSKWLVYFISFVLVFIFFLLYKNANPLFDNFTKNINLDFISPQWILFMIFGLFLMYGFFYHKVIQLIAEKDEAMPDGLSVENVSVKPIFNLSMESENRSGITLLIALNALLLLVNLLDANFMFISSRLPAGLSHSEFVHQGTGTLILSIIVAILIILFYFRGGLNFYHNNKRLKMLAYVWIIQNAFMIFSTAYRNNLYIAEFSLTYKRIGVYVWLLLALIGLITTFVKIFKVKSNWYLFRSNGWLFYGALVISCVFNWDAMVADYNISCAAKNNKAIDKYYLLNLSAKTLPALLSLDDSIQNKQPEGKEADLFSREYQPADNEFKPLLDKNVYYFFEAYNKQEWKSWNYSDKKIHDRIVELNKQGKINSMELHDKRNYYSLAEIRELDGISKMDLSGTQIEVRELAPFKKLRTLNLSGSSISSILAFPNLGQLTSLDLSNNSITSLAMVKNAPNLEFLDVSGNYYLHDFKSLLRLKKLRRLVIGNITKKGFDTLQSLFPGTEVDATIIN